MISFGVISDKINVQKSSISSKFMWLFHLPREDNKKPKKKTKQNKMKTKTMCAREKPKRKRNKNLIESIGAFHRLSRSEISKQK